jgi:hypothetical protein
VFLSTASVSGRTDLTVGRVLDNYPPDNLDRAQPRQHYPSEVRERLAELNTAEQASHRSLFDQQHDDGRDEPT